MFNKASFIKQRLQFGLKSFSTQAPGTSSLYVWKSPARLSAKTSQTGAKYALSAGKPALVDHIPNPIKVKMGLRASGVITKEGQLWTFGNGNWGVLGHGNEKNINHNMARRVDKFHSQGIKIEDVEFGRYHAAALDTDGQMWTWGYGGKAGYFNYFNQQVGALGHGDMVHHFEPQRVTFFSEHGLKVKQIATGITHTVALADDGNVYCWGQGLYGVLGNGANSASLLPIANEEFQILKAEAQEEGLDFQIKKICAADEFTACLTTDGQLFSWGKNDKGQLGVGSGVGIDMIESQNLPTLIDFSKDTSQFAEITRENVQIKDFTTGMNTMMMIDSEDRIYKTGLKIDYDPTCVNFSEDMLTKSAIKKLVCGEKHYVVLDVSENSIHASKGVFSKSFDEQHEGFRKYNCEELFQTAGAVTELSMKYDCFGAIVQH